MKNEIQITKSETDAQVAEQTQALFWAGARAKLCVARRQVAQGKVADGATVMEEIIAEFADQSIKRKQSGK